MNKEKVYIEGRVVGSFADTLGSKGKQIHLISGDIVDVDDSFIIESIKPKKVVIPQFVADVIEGAREQSAELEDAFEYARDAAFRGELGEWFMKLENRNTFARAWLDGYEVEKEPKYTVKIKGISGYGRYLNKVSSSKKYCFASENEAYGYITKHTRKELEEAGFGWVFDCPGIEVREVEE